MSLDKLHFLLYKFLLWILRCFKCIINKQHNSIFMCSPHLQVRVHILSIFSFIGNSFNFSTSLILFQLPIESLAILLGFIQFSIINFTFLQNPSSKVHHFSCYCSFCRHSSIFESCYFMIFSRRSPQTQISHLVHLQL